MAPYQPWAPTPHFENHYLTATVWFIGFDHIDINMPTTHTEWLWDSESQHRRTCETFSVLHFLPRGYYKRCLYWSTQHAGHVMSDDKSCEHRVWCSEQTEALIQPQWWDCRAFSFLLFLHLLSFHYAPHVPMTSQYKPTIPGADIIVMQQLPVQSYPPLTSTN